MRMATLASTPRTSRFTVSLATVGPFPLEFRLFDSDGLTVFVDGIIRSEWVLSAVFLDGFCDTAKISFLSPLAAGVRVQIDGSLVPKRLLDYINGDPNFVNKMNVELARMWSAIAETKMITGRSLRGLNDNAAIIDLAATDITSIPASRDQAAASAAASAASAAVALQKENSMIRDRGIWATAVLFKPSDTFNFGGDVYITQTEHISVSVPTDLLAGRIRVWLLKGAPGAGSGNMNNEDNFAFLTNKPLAYANIGGRAVGKVNLVPFSLMDPSAIISDTETLFANPSNSGLPTGKAVVDYVEGLSVPAAPLATYSWTGLVTEINLLNLSGWDEVEIQGEITGSSIVIALVSPDNGITVRTAGYSSRANDTRGILTNGMKTAFGNGGGTMRFRFSIKEMANPNKRTSYESNLFADVDPFIYQASGVYNIAEITNAIRIIAGTISGGFVKVYGIRRVPKTLPITALTLPVLSPIVADAVLSSAYFPGTYATTSGTIVSQVPTYLVNGGEQSASYIALAGDVVTVSVLVTNSVGNTRTFSTFSQTAAINSAPVVTAMPRVVGLPQPGKVLTLAGYVFQGEGALTFEFGWQRTQIDIPLAVSATYTATIADATYQVRGKVRAIDSLGRISDWAYSDPVDVDYAALTFATVPSTNASTYVQGSTVVISQGALSLAGTIETLVFSVNGVDKRAELVLVSPGVYTWNSGVTAAGTILFQCRGYNSSSEVLSAIVSRPLTAPSIVVPGIMATGDWGAVNEGSGGKITFTVITPPTNGGTAITGYDVQKDGTTTISLGIAAAGDAIKSGFTNGVAANYLIRAVNSAGVGPWSVTNKAVTPSDLVAPNTTSLTYDTPTNAISVVNSEPAKVWYLIEAAATVHTGAALKALVQAATPLSFGSINIGVAEVTPTFTAAAGAYYIKTAGEDASGNLEALCEIVLFDWPGVSSPTVPVLTLPTDTKNGSSACNGTVSAALNNGTLRVVASTSATAPSAAQMEAGQMHTGAAAPNTSLAVSVVGVQNVAISGLAALTTYYLHYFQRSQSGVASVVVSADGFTTDAAVGQVEFVSSVLMLSSTSSSPPGTPYVSATNHTVSSNANRVTVLKVSGTLDVPAGGAPSIVSFTYGGVTPIQVQAPSSSGSRDWVATYIVIGASPGAKSCSIEVSSTQRAISVRADEYRNVNQTTPVEQSASLTSGASLVNTYGFSRTTVQNGNMLASSINLASGIHSPDLTVSADATLIAAERTGTTSSSDQSTASAYEAVPTAGANGHSYSWITTERCTLTWLELKAA